MERNDECDEERFEVQLADEAVYALVEVALEAVYRRILDMLDILARFPYYGEEYNPYYEAAKPPVACRVLFVAHYGVYYCVDESKRVVTVLAIESTRRDPAARFRPYR